MKAGWTLRRLGEVCEFDKSPGVHSGLPYVGLEDIESQTARFIGSVEPQTVKSSTFKFSTQHVLYGRLRPYLNKVLAPEFSGHCSTEIFPIKPGPFLSREYLLYWFLSEKIVEQINATCTGARMPRADMSEVLDFHFPLPPLPEQQRIVTLLDEAFDGIATARAHAEKNLQNARAIFESHLQSVFSNKAKEWPDRLLGDVFHIGSSKRIYETDWTTQGVPFFGGREIVKLANFGSVESVSFISEEKYQEYALKYEMPQADDILMTARGTIGVGYIVKPGDKFYYKDGNVISLRAKKPSNPQFVIYAFRSNAVLNQLTVLVGTTVSHLPIEKAKKLKICMPTFEAQNLIVEHLEMREICAKELENIYQRKLLALDELKKSLLAQAFSGAL